ncbi:hypothetical protein LMIY3S_02724 [Labrys miyagiensis]
MTKIDIPQHVTGGQLADFLGLSPRRIRQLATDHVIPHAGPQGYDFARCISGLIEHGKKAKEPDAAFTAKVRLTQARARTAERRAALAEGDLMPVDVAKEHFMAVGAALADALTGLPAEVAGHDLPLRRRLEAGVRTVRERIAMRIRKAIETAQSGGETQ